MESNRNPAYQPNTSPLDQAGSLTSQCQQTATFEEKEETIRENRTHVVRFTNRLAKLAHFGSGIHVSVYRGVCLSVHMQAIISMVWYSRWCLSGCLFICTHAGYHFYGLVFTLVFIRVPVYLYTCRLSFLWSGIHVGVYPIHSHKTLDTAQPCHLLKPN